MNHLKPIKVVFLDMDGVTNGHEKMSNHYSRTRRDCVDFLNLILHSDDNVRIVVSSAWRYYVLSGSMNHEGLQNLLLSHGVDCFGRFIGITESDEDTAERLGSPRPDFSSQKAWHEWIKEHGCRVRREQIYKFVNERPEIERFIVIDDLDLDMPFLVQTDGNAGLQCHDVRRAIELLTADAAAQQQPALALA